MFQLIFNDLLVEVEEIKLRQIFFKCHIKNLMEAVFGNGSPAEAGNDAANVQVAHLARSADHIVGNYTTDSDLERTVDNDGSLDAFQSIGNFGSRERTVRLNR